MAAVLSSLMPGGCRRHVRIKRPLLLARSAASDGPPPAASASMPGGHPPAGLVRWRAICQGALMPSSADVPSSSVFQLCLVSGLRARSLEIVSEVPVGRRPSAATSRSAPAQEAVDENGRSKDRRQPWRSIAARSVAARSLPRHPGEAVAPALAPASARSSTTRCRAARPLPRGRAP